MNVSDLRRSERYIADPPIEASFGRTTVIVRDVAEGGVQIEHEDPLLLFDQSVLSMMLPVRGNPLEFRGVVVWSRLHPSAAHGGRYLYRSGIKLGDDPTAPMHEAIRKLVAAGIARPDSHSLDRKRRVLEEKARQLVNQRFLRPVEPPIPASEIRRIEQARDHLHARPEEEIRWAAAGKSLLEYEGRDQQGLADDVIAVWAYLDCSVDLGSIARVLRELSH